MLPNKSVRVTIGSDEQSQAILIVLGVCLLFWRSSKAFIVSPHCLSINSLLRASKPFGKNGALSRHENIAVQAVRMGILGRRGRVLPRKQVKRSVYNLKSKVLKLMRKQIKRSSFIHTAPRGSLAYSFVFSQTRRPSRTRISHLYLCLARPNPKRVDSHYVRLTSWFVFN